MQRLRKWEVELRSYTKPWIDTSGSLGSDLVFSILASVAEFERSLIRERIMAGLDRAHRQGVHLGRRKLSLPN